MSIEYETIVKKNVGKCYYEEIEKNWNFEHTVYF